MLFVSHLAAFCTAFSRILPCVQQQNARHLAPKRTAFSIKTHSILQQIAPKQVQMAAFSNKNSFSCIHMLPLFASKQTFARIDYLRQGGQLVDKKGTHNVKFYAENWTKETIPPYTRAWTTAQRTYALTTACASDCRAFNKKAKARLTKNKRRKPSFHVIQTKKDRVHHCSRPPKNQRVIKKSSCLSVSQKFKFSFILHHYMIHVVVFALHHCSAMICLPCSTASIFSGIKL